MRRRANIPIISIIFRGKVLFSYPSWTGDLPLVTSLLYFFFVIALVDVVHKNLVGHVFGLLNKCLKAKAAALMCHAASYMELLGLATWHLIQHN